MEADFDYELFKKLRLKRYSDLTGVLAEIKELEGDEDSLEIIRNQEAYLKDHPELLKNEPVLINDWPLYHRDIPASTRARIDKLHAEGVFLGYVAFDHTLETSKPIFLRIFFHRPTREKPLLKFIKEKLKEFQPADYYSSPWMYGRTEGKLYFNDPFLAYPLNSIWRWACKNDLPWDVVLAMKNKEWPKKEV